MFLFFHVKLELAINYNFDWEKSMKLFVSDIVFAHLRRILAAFQ